MNTTTLYMLYMYMIIAFHEKGIGSGQDVQAYLVTPSAHQVEVLVLIIICMIISLKYHLTDLFTFVCLFV